MPTEASACDATEAK